MFDNVGGKCKKTIIISIIGVLLISILTLIVNIVLNYINYINKTTYKIDMDYHQENIEHFIDGIQEYGGFYSISISDIDVDENRAVADIYVEKLINKPVEIRLIFEYDYDGIDTKKRYTLRIAHFSSFSEIVDIETAVSVAKSIEIMLTGETQIQEGHNSNYNPEDWTSSNSYTYYFDNYRVDYHYNYVTKDSFNYIIVFLGK